MGYRFSYKTYRLPLRPPLRTAHGSWSVREGVVVRLEDGAGRVGFGEIAPLPWFGTETLEEAESICRGFGERVTAEALAAVPARLGCVRFALEAAGNQGVPQPSTFRLPVAALLPAGKTALEALPDKIEAGFLAFKWKVGVGEMDDELGILDDLLSMLPAYTRLRLDANGAWTARQATRWLERCAERPIEFIEQPAAPGDEDALWGLANDFPVKIALDESAVHLEDLRRWQMNGWTGVFIVKPALAGPLSELRRLVEETAADIVLSSALETAIGRHAVLQAALKGKLTKRALGFGLGDVFGNRQLDGPVVGPLLDSSWCAGVNLEETWTALS